MGQIRRFLARYEVAVGLVVTLACSLGGQWLVTLPGLSLVGALVLALLLGMALQGVTSLRDAARQSTPFIANKFLRAGIILLGFKLNLILLMGAGMKSLLAAIVVVTVMVTLNYVVARRLFGVEHTLAVLTACGSSICGAAAVMGVAGAAKAKADDSVLAVACVAILGTAFTLVLVALQPVLGFSAPPVGQLVRSARMPPSWRNSPACCCSRRSPYWSVCWRRAARLSRSVRPLWRAWVTWRLRSRLQLRQRHRAGGRS